MSKDSKTTKGNTHDENKIICMDDEEVIKYYLDEKGNPISGPKAIRMAVEKIFGDEKTKSIVQKLYERGEMTFEEIQKYMNSNKEETKEYLWPLLFPCIVSIYYKLDENEEVCPHFKLTNLGKYIGKELK